MGEVEKPFGCPEPSCGMSFTNEDHLQVHCHQHEMQLNNCFGQSSSSLKPPSFVTDQTPTPTRFLKQGEDLFHDIGLNPFDIEFHNASHSRRNLGVPEIQCSNDSLETPRIVPPVESDETISSTSRDDILLCTSASSNTGLVSQSNCAISSSLIISRKEQRLVPDRKEPKRRLTLNVTSASESGGQSNVISTPTPVITAGPSVSQSLGNVGSTTPSLDTPTILHTGTSSNPTICLNTVNDLEISLSPNIPFSSPETQSSPPAPQLPIRNESTMSTNVVVPPHVTNVSLPSTNCTLPSPATVLQLVLRFPNGQSVPVEIPANPVVSAISPLVNSSSVSIAPAPVITNISSQVLPSNSSSLAKMKLKEALASSNTAARPGSTKHSRANTANRIAEMTWNNLGGHIDLQEDSSSSCSSGTSNPVLSSSASPGRKRRGSNSDDHPFEKRQKMLERNRVAAVRCREKKKKFVESLSVKSDELLTVNQRLQSDVAFLKSEVASLKSLLLKHKDCPVTMAMRGEETFDGVPSAPTVFTTFKIEKPSGIITEVTKTPIYPKPQPQPLFIAPPLSNPIPTQEVLLSSIPVRGSLELANTNYATTFTPSNTTMLTATEPTSLPLSTTVVSSVMRPGQRNVSSVTDVHQVHKPRSRSQSLPSLSIPTSLATSTSCLMLPPIKATPLSSNNDGKLTHAPILTSVTLSHPAVKPTFLTTSTIKEDMKRVLISQNPRIAPASKITYILPQTLVSSYSPNATNITTSRVQIDPTSDIIPQL